MPAVVRLPGAVKSGYRVRPSASATFRTPTCAKRAAYLLPKSRDRFRCENGHEHHRRPARQVGLRQDPGVDVFAQRLRAQLLCGPPATQAVGVVKQLLALQAQDFVGARLSVRARSTGLTAAHVDRALGERELVVSSLNRGTLHLVRSEDLPWLHALTTPQLASSNRTRLRQEGVDESQAERAVAVISQDRCWRCGAHRTASRCPARLARCNSALLTLSSRCGRAAATSRTGTSPAALLRPFYGTPPRGANDPSCTAKTMSHGFVASWR